MQPESAEAKPMQRAVVLLGGAARLKAKEDDYEARVTTAMRSGLEMEGIKNICLRQRPKLGRSTITDCACAS